MQREVVTVEVEPLRDLAAVRETLIETMTAFDCAMEEWWVGTQSDAVWDRMLWLRKEIRHLHEEVAGQPMQ